MRHKDRQVEANRDKDESKIEGGISPILNKTLSNILIIMFMSLRLIVKHEHYCVIKALIIVCFCIKCDL